MPKQQHNEEAQAALVQSEIVDAINHLIADGIPAPIVLAGVGAAASAAIHSLYGPEHIGRWFAMWNDAARSLPRG